MKKAILATILLISTIWCDAGNGLTQAGSTSITPKTYWVNDTIAIRTYQPCLMRVDSAGNVYDRWSRVYVGSDCDSARLSAFRRLSDLNNDKGLGYTPAQIQTYITNNNVK